jgi:hypothetical protein
MSDDDEVAKKLGLFLATEGAAGERPDWAQAFLYGPELSMPVWDAAEVLGLEPVPHEEWINRARIWIAARSEAIRMTMDKAMNREGSKIQWQ